MKKLRFIKSRIWCGEESRIYSVIGEAFAGLLVVDTRDINGNPTVYVYHWNIDTHWSADTPPVNKFARPSDEELGRQDPFELALEKMGFEVTQ